MKEFGRLRRSPPSGMAGRTGAVVAAADATLAAGIVVNLEDGDLSAFTARARPHWRANGAALN